MKKERPTWATIVGVLGIIFSCFGILGAGYDIGMPQMMNMQKEMFANMEKIQQNSVQTKGSDNVPPEEFFEMFKTMEKMWETPDWFGIYSVISGILKLALCGFALFASICLLQTKPSSIKLFYWSAGLNIGFVLFKTVFLLASMSLMAVAMMFGNFFGLVVNIVLIIVVALGDKSAFIKDQPPLSSAHPQMAEQS